MIHGIIFDFDGVLVDSERANIEAAIQTFKNLGAPLNNEEIAYIPGKSSKDFIPLFLRKRAINNPSIHEQWYEKNRKNYNTLWNDVVVMPPNTKETIEALLVKEIKLAIATTNRREIVAMFLKKFNMQDNFTVIVTDEDVKERKPNPEIYLLVVDRLRIPKGNVIAVEDTTTGLQAAKEAGIKCAVIPNNYHTQDDFSGADFIFESMQNLLEII